MKIYKIILPLVFLTLINCKTIKSERTFSKDAILDYTFKNDSVLILESSMQFGYAQRVKDYKNKLDTDSLKRIDTETVLTKLDIAFPIGNKPYLSPNKNLATYRSGYSFKKLNNTVTSDPKVPDFHFKRIFNPKESRFKNLALDFQIVSHYLKSGEVVFTIDSLKFDYTKVKISKSYPVALIGLEIKLALKDGKSFVTPRLIIPAIAGQNHLLEQINYRNYYTKALPIDGFRSMEINSSEILLEDLAHSKFIEILKTHSELPDILRAISENMQP
jgi:hypothetical protein